VITKLIFNEIAVIDQDRATELYVRLGAAGADNLVSQALEELAILLIRVQKSFEQSRLNEVRTSCEKISATAIHIGMLSLSAIAGDAAKLASGNDGVAMSAIVARLGRIGKASLLEDWDLKDLSL
jgi:hypothetical protein